MSKVGEPIRFIVMAVIVIVVVVIGLRSCSATASAKSVTCSQFNAMSSSQQDSTLNALLSSHAKQTGGSNLFAAHAQVMMGCSGNPSAKIDNVMSWN